MFARLSGLCLVGSVDGFGSAVEATAEQASPLEQTCSVGLMHFTAPPTTRSQSRSEPDLALDLSLWVAEARRQES